MPDLHDRDPAAITTLDFDDIAAQWARRLRLSFDAFARGAKETDTHYRLRPVRFIRDEQVWR